jgi:CheY-like chemotaxis protein
MRVRLFQDAAAPAPRQELGVGRNVIHQRVHLGRRVGDQYRTDDMLHRRSAVRHGIPKIQSMSIVDNKKAFFDYFIEDRYEAGLELEGWEVKAIRAGNNNQNVPILVLTTETSDAMKTAFRAAGASGWMSKPFTPERLEAALKKLLGN